MTVKNLPLEVDLQGRVANMRLAPTNTLYALYEAVVNSIHAILDGPEPKSGKITIRVLRGPGQQRSVGDKAVGPVVGFQVEDNGIGFDEQNFTSFRRSDSTTKAKFGGKGVGRLNWLKVFQSIHIASVFTVGNERQERVFNFSTQGIEGQSVAATTRPRTTVVTMKSPCDGYRDALQHEPETIARSTIEHCLEYFISEPRPLFYLQDEEVGYNAELGKLFAEDLKSEIKRDQFRVGRFEFTIAHLLLKGRKNSKHALHFCAHQRRVKDESLSSKVPGLSAGLRRAGSDEELAYQGYVSGPRLDELVDAGRTAFAFDEFVDAAEGANGGSVTGYDTLVAGAISKARGFLDATLKPILEANAARIRKQVETTYPQYRHLLKHRSEEIAAIPPGTDGRELDLALYKIEQRFDAESRDALGRELEQVTDPDEPAEARRARLDALMAQLNDSGISKLARHVAYRRAIIDFLDDQLGLQATGKYTLEEAVHAAICPTKTTSDDVAHSQMNLWLLDDRLYFHYYLASDMPFSELKDTVMEESEDRPDLAIFHRPMAFSDAVDQIGAVVLVEFKRPSRDDFKVDDPDKNPVSQVLKYVDTLRSGSGRRSKGRAIHIRENTPFTAYIVADFTKTLRALAKREDFLPTPDGEGFFKFYQNYNCYVEMVSFQKMIHDAKKRNQAFFDKLNIPLHD